jgi:hypothetical protein
MKSHAGTEAVPIASFAGRFTITETVEQALAEPD